MNEAIIEAMWIRLNTFLFRQFGDSYRVRSNDTLVSPELGVLLALRVETEQGAAFALLASDNHQPILVDRKQWRAARVAYCKRDRRNRRRDERRVRRNERRNESQSSAASASGSIRLAERNEAEAL